jgi:hypothetical protein
MVGLSAMILVGVAGAQINILRDRPRRPNATYNALNWHPNLPASLALRANARWALISVPIPALGLWLTHLMASGNVAREGGSGRMSSGHLGYRTVAQGQITGPTGLRPERSARPGRPPPKQ